MEVLHSIATLAQYSRSFHPTLRGKIGRGRCVSAVGHPCKDGGLGEDCTIGEPLFLVVELGLKMKIKDCGVGKDINQYLERLGRACSYMD